MKVHVHVHVWHVLPTLFIWAWLLSNDICHCVPLERHLVNLTYVPLMTISGVTHAPIQFLELATIYQITVLIRVTGSE